ncbi:CoA transferase [Alcaligenaceae bacterium]|nr:CoA transferase [Alcaligenaceae bacterium]
MFLLSDVRILAVEQYGAGPFGTSYLTALGAEVIKIEQPREGGDVTRHLGPYFDENLPETGQSLFFQSLNHGKKSLSLDLNTERGRQLFHRLAKTADAVISNLRGDVPERLGLTYEQMKAHNPALVCGHLTGYGRAGERANWPGYDYLMQAEAGYFSLTGEPDSPPSRMGLSMIDYMTGVVMSLGLVSGIMKARQTGIGCDIDVSLYDVALHNLNYLAVWHLNAGDTPGRRTRSAHPSLVPCQLYKTRDGWIYLMCNKEKFWHSLCDRIERPDLAVLPAFRSFKDRLANRDELTVVLDEILGTRTTAEWMLKFASSVPAAPVHTVEQALSSEFANQDGRIEEVPTGGKPMRVMRNPIQVSTGNPHTALSPALGRDTSALLTEIGVSEQEQAALRADGVI